jgi:hypothetical protein
MYMYMWRTGSKEKDNKETHTYTCVCVCRYVDIYLNNFRHVYHAHRCDLGLPAVDKGDTHAAHSKAKA